MALKHCANPKGDMEVLNDLREIHLKDLGLC